MHIEESYPNLQLSDVAQLALPQIEFTEAADGKVLYHPACHAEWAGIGKLKARKQIASTLQDKTGFQVELNEGCCGESGMGSMTSPGIYNTLRARKQANLRSALDKGYEGPILVGCPSCKIGIGRSLLAMQQKNPVLHINEWLAGQLDGEDRRQSFRKRVNETKGEVRVVSPHAPTQPANLDG